MPPMLLQATELLWLIKTLPGTSFEDMYATPSLIRTASLKGYRITSACMKNHGVPEAMALQMAIHNGMEDHFEHLATQ